MSEIPKLKEKFLSQCPDINFGEYVWETTVGPQLGYSFAKPHALAYSFVGIQTLYLATHFPVAFWNCACLIIKAGGAELLEADSEDKKNKSVNYGKISIAIGETREKGIEVLLPDINKSDLIFTPDIERNGIIYGLKGINSIGTSIVMDIFKNRPYNSIQDFLLKVKVNKTQMMNLIKAGAFDQLYKDLTREEIVNLYLDMISDKKKRITLQNMQMLVNKELIPQELEEQKRLFNFNKYLKRFKEKDYYELDNNSMRYFCDNYDSDILEDVSICNNKNSGKIKCSIWDNTYKQDIEPVRVWMKDKQESILKQLNDSLFEEAKEKYAEGNISHWEMESVGFYAHEHELEKLKNLIYGISDFNKLKEEPEIERTFTTKEGSTINIYKINRIAGTVIDKDKNKGEVVLLTTTGVVTVKVWKNQFASWDKQISKRDINGDKHVVEKSWFARGTKLLITGIRRGDNFVPKKYKNTEWPLFERIDELTDDGFILESATERVEEDE